MLYNNSVTWKTLHLKLQRYQMSIQLQQKSLDFRFIVERFGEISIHIPKVHRLISFCGHHLFPLPAKPGL